MLVLVLSALAHVPHTMVTALVPAPDLDDAEPWWVLATPYLPLLFRSDDGGASFVAVGGEPLGDLPTDMTRLLDGTLVLVGRTRYWWSVDGQTWSSNQLPGQLDAGASAGHTLLLGGDGGLYELELGGEVRRPLSVPVRHLRGGVYPVATGADGLVYLRDEGAWRALDPLPGGAVATAAAADGHGLFAGGDDGTVARWTGGGWAACAPLPEAGWAHSTVVAVAVDHAKLLVGTGNTAPYVSSDGCASWSRPSLPAVTDWRSSGAPSTEREVVVDLFARGERAVWAGWAGVWRRPANTWISAPLLGADYTRGAALALDPEAVLPRLYVGSYGAGVLRSDDGGRSWTGRNAQMTGANVQDVQVDAGDVDTVYALAGHYLNVSRDGSENAVGPLREAKATALSVDSTVPGEVWAQFDDGLAWSADAGGTWSAPVVTGAAGDFTRHLRLGNELCTFFQRPFEAWCAPGAEGSWTARHASPAEAPSPVVGVPARAPSRVLAGLDDTVVASDDGMATVTTVLALDADRVTAMAVADDDTVLIATLAGALLASDDHGDTWVEVGLRLPAAPWTLAARPGFAEHPEVVVATLDGTFLLTDPLGEPTLARLAPFQRVDDASEFWSFGEESCAPSHDDARGVMGTLRALDEGCVLRQWIRGAEIRVLGVAGGAASLSVDRGDETTFGSPSDDGNDEVTELIAVTVDDGWHLVEIRGLVGGVMFDALEASGSGAFLSTPGRAARDRVEPPAPEPCACAAGSIVPGWALVLAAAASRRRG